MSRTLKRIKEALRRRMHCKSKETARWLGKVLDGWLNYYAVPNSYRYLGPFYYPPEATVVAHATPTVAEGPHDMGRYHGTDQDHWPKLEIRHPWPDQRFAVSAMRGRNPREEPDALAGLSGSVRGALGNQRPYRDSRPRRR